MDKIAVLTDSTSCMSRPIAEQEGVIVIPCQVRFGEESYREGIDLSSEELFQRVFEGGEIPDTSMPLGEDFIAGFEEAGRRGATAALGIFLGSSFSGTFNGARIAAAETPLQVELVDSGTTSLGLALLALHAAGRARDPDVCLGELAAETHRLAQGAAVYAMLDTLEYARKGGRIGRVTETVAAFLNIKAILCLTNNSVDAVARVRSPRRAMSWLVDKAHEIAPRHGIAVIHSGAIDMAHELAEQVRPLLQPGQDLLIEPVGAALAAHAGPGAVGFGLVR